MDSGMYSKEWFFNHEYDYGSISNDTKSHLPINHKYSISEDYCQRCDLAVWIQSRFFIASANCPITSARLHPFARLMINWRVYRPIRFEEIVTYDYVDNAKQSAKDPEDSLTNHHI